MPEFGEPNTKYVYVDIIPLSIPLDSSWPPLLELD